MNNAESEQITREKNKSNRKRNLFWFRFFQLHLYEFLLWLIISIIVITFIYCIISIIYSIMFHFFDLSENFFVYTFNIMNLVADPLGLTISLYGYSITLILFYLFNIKNNNIELVMVNLLRHWPTEIRFYYYTIHMNVKEYWKKQMEKLISDTIWKKNYDDRDSNLNKWIHFLLYLLAQSNNLEKRNVIIPKLIIELFNDEIGTINSSMNEKKEVITSKMDTIIQLYSKNKKPFFKITNDSIKIMNKKLHYILLKEFFSYNEIIMRYNKIEQVIDNCNLTIDIKASILMDLLIFLDGYEMVFSIQYIYSLFSKCYTKCINKKLLDNDIDKRESFFSERFKLIEVITEKIGILLKNGETKKYAEFLSEIHLFSFVLAINKQKFNDKSSQKEIEFSYTLLKNCNIKNEVFLISILIKLLNNFINYSRQSIKDSKNLLQELNDFLKINWSIYNCYKRIYDILYPKSGTQNEDSFKSEISLLSKDITSVIILSFQQNYLLSKLIETNQNKLIENTIKYLIKKE